MNKKKIILVSNSDRQHRITESYLKNFVSPSRDGRLWVYKQGTARPERKGPRRVSTESHLFDIIGVPGHERELEDSFSLIETDAIPAVKKLIASQQLSEGELGYIILLIASLMVRGVRFDDHTIREIMHWCHNNPSGGQSLLGDFFALGGPGNLVIPAPAITSGHVPPCIINRIRPFVMRHYVAALGRFHWFTVKSNDAAPDLVTSDNPVDQTNDGNPPPPGGVMGSNAPAIPNPTDMVKPGSLVTFPLGPRHALIGTVPRIGEAGPKEEHLLSDGEVRDINVRTVRSASEIYSPTNNFSPPAGWGNVG